MRTRSFTSQMGKFYKETGDLAAMLFDKLKNTLPPGSIDFDVNKLREGFLCLNNIVFRRRYMS